MCVSSGAVLAHFDRPDLLLGLAFVLVVMALAAARFAKLKPPPAGFKPNPLWRAPDHGHTSLDPNQQ